MNKVLDISILGLIVAGSAIAEPLTWNLLMTSATNDPVLQASQKRSELVKSDRPTKLWDNMEFRYKMDGFSLASHDFELRVKPKAFGEGSADKQYYQAQRNYQEARLGADRSYIIYERYDRAIQYVIRKKIAELNKQIYQVNQDRIEVLHLKAGAETFSMQELISAIEAEASLRADLMSDEASLRDAELKMRSWVDFDSVNLDVSYLPSIEELAASLEKGFTISENAPLIMKAKSKMESEQAKANQDLAKNRDIITHIGVGYEWKIESRMEKYKEFDASDFADQYSPYYEKYYDRFLEDNGCASMGECSKAHKTASYLVSDLDNRKTADKFFLNVGIKLPFFDSNNGSALKNQVAQLDAESDYLDAMRQVSQKVGRLSEEIVSLIAQWKVQKEFVEKVNAGNLFVEVASNAVSDPLLLLRARESALESDIKAVKLESEIYSRYLALLDYAGVLANNDLTINHLREGLK